MARAVTCMPQEQLHSAGENLGEEETTDVKLARLASLTQCTDPGILLEALLSCRGVVDDARECLGGPPQPTRKKRRTVHGHQSSLAAWSSSPQRSLVTKKGKTLHLYSPDDIAANTPCSLITNFLPRAQADTLLLELLVECQTYGKETFKVFEQVVESPHTMCFYVDDWAEVERQRNDYVYNGSRIKDVRKTTPEMERAAGIVQRTVNTEIKKRIRDHYPESRKLKYQSPKEWIPNAAFVNCYDGGKESVGYHSDQLTYLGPRAIIGSLSLGVAREFRVRKINPRLEASTIDATSNVRSSDEDGQIAIHLPHNSLLVMHAEMQESWKHSIAPSQTIEPHPLSKNKRLNITYRCYRDAFHPTKTPKCKQCKTGTVLRCVQKQHSNLGRYFWMCQNGLTAGQEGCDFFEWAVFDDDGEPLWASAHGDSTADQSRAGLEGVQ